MQILDVFRLIVPEIIFYQSSIMVLSAGPLFNNFNFIHFLVVIGFIGGIHSVS